MIIDFQLGCIKSFEIPHLMHVTNPTTGIRVICVFKIISSIFFINGINKIFVNKKIYIESVYIYLMRKLYYFNRLIKKKTVFFSFPSVQSNNQKKGIFFIHDESDGTTFIFFFWICS
jgi:hypothetical protein